MLTTQGADLGPPPCFLVRRKGEKIYKNMECASYGISSTQRGRCYRDVAHKLRGEMLFLCLLCSMPHPRSRLVELLFLYVGCRLVLGFNRWKGNFQVR